jgi:hypothetical protein
LGAAASSPRPNAVPGDRAGLTDDGAPIVPTRYAGPERAAAVEQASGHAPGTCGAGGLQRPQTRERRDGAVLAVSAR